jgi:hypothetical protein
LGWQSFILELLKALVDLVKALAWPLAAVVVAMLFRRPFSGLIGRITKLKYKDAEADFDRKLRKAEAEAAVALPPAETAKASDQPEGVYAALAKLSPRSAVLEAWKDLISEAEETAKRNAIDPSEWERRPPIKLIEALQKAAIIGPLTAKLLNIMRDLRNIAEHGTKSAFKTESAMDYVALAKRLMESLQSPRLPRP